MDKKILTGSIIVLLNGGPAAWPAEVVSAQSLDFRRTIVGKSVQPGEARLSALKRRITPRFIPN